MSTPSENIAAISTAPGAAGISVVRISGPGALAIADKVIHASRKPSDIPGGSFLYGKVRNPDDSIAPEILDEAIVLVFRSPHSYTREDVVEIQCHGGRVSAAQTLRSVLAAGARPAEPGEFTRRAFLEGRLDLTQAEAVMDLICARTERAARSALEQLDGSLSASCASIYDDVLHAASEIEASIDFDEDETLQLDTKDVSLRLARAEEYMNKLLATWDEGHIMREGAVVIVAGRPNVGKSSVLNRLLGSNRAIVSSQPGTTRDTIEEQISLQGIPIRLVDTAGLRDADCFVEQQGVQRAKTSIATADIVLYVVDSSQPVNAEDVITIHSISGRKRLVLLNKSDLGQICQASAFGRTKTLPCSMATGQGLDDIRAAIVEILGIAHTKPHASISERHRVVVQDALTALKRAGDTLDFSEPATFVTAAALLRSCMLTLDMITGRTYTDELLNSVFSRFCIGK